ncbi:MAG TPA: hypothetical protein VNZ58_09630 [Thermomicrobiales bacterium]|nr:hypothetical protein [Thermomicrobiales bacterium]
MGGTGWCTHPKRQTSSDVRILVRKAELACRNAWGEDLWESLDNEEIDDPVAASTPEVPEPDEIYPPISFEDEITSVVDADVHHAKSRDDHNDRVMEQSSLDPDEDDETAQGDSRFDLLARGGRDSVSAARRRILDRRNNPDSVDDDASPRSAASGHDRFRPDDYVEEEGPAPLKETSTPEASPYDDVILSENVPQGSPRSRRFRREREKHTPPKSDAVVETSPNVPAPANTPGTMDFTVGDSFNTVPEISSDIDISRLRKSGPAPRREASPHIRAESARESAPSVPSFEEAIQSADAIRAAARIEREGRQRKNHRAQILPRVTPPSPPAQMEDPVSDAAPAAPAAFIDEPAYDDEDISPPESSRIRMSTRQFEEPRPAIAMSGATDTGWEDADLPQRDDPRSSWWRGLFQTRRRSTAGGQAIVDDVMAHDWDDEEAIVDTYDADQPVDEKPWPEDTDVWDDQPYIAADREPRRMPNVATAAERTPAPSMPRQEDPAYAPLDLEVDSGMESFRDRLFNRPEPPPVASQASRRPQPSLVPEDLLEDPSSAWYEPEPVPGFDVRQLIDNTLPLLDMTIEIAPDVPRQCSTCRNYRQSERSGRGWCTNNWAFTHRQMVNATDLACASTIGCWWLPTDEETWLNHEEPVRRETPRVDKLIAHLDPLKKVVGK